MNVCRRILRHAQDAEDAFQATFLVLAKKAGSLRWHDSVGCWLYGVATRLALRARADGNRRRTREREAASVPPAGESNCSELCRILDDEMDRLPDKSRLPLVLCYLEGKTRDQAALQLGWSLRTLERRLEQGRELLRTRLLRRGVTMSAVLLSAALTNHQAQAAITPALALATARAAVHFSIGSGGVPAAVAALANQGLKAMFMTKVKIAAALMLTALAMVAGAAALPPAEARKEPAAADEKPAEPERPLPASDRQIASAITSGLAWIAKQQQADGHWSLDGSFKNDIAGTAFGLMPLLRSPDAFKRDYPYAKNIDRGLKYLLARQAADGSLDPNVYANALAGLALCEAYGNSSDPLLKKPAQRAVDYIVSAQSQSGAWGYTAGSPRGDTSITGWNVQALKSAQMAGLTVPKRTLEKVYTYLDSAHTPDGGYSYIAAAGNSTPTMTASGVFSRQCLGWGPEKKELAKGVELLKKQAVPNAIISIYHYYYVTQVMNSIGADSWRWNRKMQDPLVAQQDQGKDRAEWKGSWYSAKDGIGQAGGRLMITSLSLLVLETRDPLSIIAGRKLPPRDLSAKELGELWGELNGDNSFRAAQVIQTLSAAPKQTVAFLDKQLKPVAEPDHERIARLIADLDSEQFAVRQKASAELEKFGDLAEPALRKKLSAELPSLEVRRRMERLLERLNDDPTADQLRVRRALQALEAIGTPEAQTVLDKLARGAEGDRQSREAAAALARLARQKERMQKP
jgi:RNA polymerase sigma factor (sigma-70 family)